MKRAQSLYTALLYCYPAPFRREYGRQMCSTFTQQLHDARHSGAWTKEASLWAQAALDIVTIAPQEHWHVIQQDLRVAIRAMFAKPAFTSVAVLSLALGIGANVAIFSVWNSVLRAPLPAVVDPHGLVTLTRPSASGMWTGQWNGQTDGPRAWVSYAEFERLRDNASAFSALIASQSSLNSWQIRYDDGSIEEAKGRLVSGRFFEVLGVRPAIGRVFSRAEDEQPVALAVLNHAYWQRRFAGSAAVLGRTFVIRRTPITIVGVAAPGFIGETSGQSPDFWLPVRLQPSVLAGGNWLTDKPPDKFMWLHLFGRLRPGVSAAQAEAQANAIFQAGQEDQRLQMRPAAGGASPNRDEFSTSLNLLLASVGILLLIACANLANLFLARGAARQNEIAIRVSLGASRSRLIRQLATESLALAALGGLAALAVANGLHGPLVAMLQESDPRFSVSFSFDRTVLVFAVGATIATALTVGIFPAWLLSKANPGSFLRDSSRGTIGSPRELRSTRWLVAVQLALSLPLLVGAGLLARTVYNLQRPQLGFQPAGLVLARVDLNEVSEDAPRSNRVLRELRERIQRIPAVDAVTFSQLGLFTGGESTASIEVEGSPLTSQSSVESGLDRVGPGYFTRLGIPLRLGRDIAESDRAESPPVCIVNEAFVRRYFDGRHPLGRHVTTIDNEVRRAYEVVGIAGNARTRSLRDEIEPRFFVPAEQRPSSGTNRTFLIRTSSERPAVVPQLREAILEVDSALSIGRISSIKEQMAPLTAEERTIARLAIVFGTLALGLAAMGLYGVLSYSVTRRSSEIAIRLALGAQSRGVVTMILRESVWLVAGGLAVGGVLAYLAPRLMASRLYGVSPEDPITFAVATGTLLLVAFVAAYLPARRASRADPLAALHQG